MTKIENIQLHNFSNNEHFWFMSDFDQLISSFPASVWGMDVLYGVFKNTLMAENLALRVEQGSLVANTLEYLDYQRDRTWNAIRLRIKSTLLSPFDDEVKSAREIERILLNYGNVCSMTYHEQSLAIANLTTDFLQPNYVLHFEILGISHWVTELKNQNEQFLSVFNQRNSDFAGRESNDVKAVRTLIDPVFKQLVEKMNASIVLEFAHPEVRNLVNKLNERIKYYKLTIASHNNRSPVSVKRKEEV